ncbi:MAG: hypothetical protein IKQ72_05685 [Bacteroidaceae bacterium]|nr:hypothetical protein [Bacteroidaceae bacterium]
MILAPILPNNNPAFMLDPTPIEYRISVSCQEEEMTNDRKTFICLTDYAMTSQKTALKNRISELDNLHDNWDMYGAIAPSDEVIKNAYKLLDIVINDGYVAIKAEDIVPTPYGSIVMDFANERGLVSVEIGKAEIGFFTEFVDGKDFASDGIETDFRSIPTALKEVFDILYDEQRSVSA